MNTRKPPSRTEVGLASWLGGGSIFIVLLAVAAIAIACAVLLDRQVSQQALVRAQLAVTSAREQLRRDGEDLLSDARDLAERPALPRLLATPQNAGLEPFLRRFSETTNVDVAALMQGNVALAQSGPGVDWSEIATALQEQGERFVVAPKDGGALIWGAATTVPGTQVRAVTLILSSPARLDALSRQVGATLQVVNFTTYHAPPDELMTPLHTRSLAAPGTAAAARLKRGNIYAASLVLAAQTGEVVGLLDASVSGAEFSAATRSFDRVLLGTALFIAAVAGLLGVLYGRWLARPVVALRDIADRIGRGDFSAAVPAVAPLEVGALARSMDEMRRRLVDLTDALRRREAEAQAVLAGVVEGVFAVDDERRIRYANAQVAKLLKRSPAEIVGQFCGDVLRPQAVHGERPCERDCPILAARHSPQASAREMLCLSDGDTRSAIVLSAPPIQGIQVQILRDETDLEAARRARDSVLGNISHEFRTPLAAQLASIELLRDGLGAMQPEAQQELLTNVERGVLRLMRLIDNLLESVRIEAGKLSIRQQPVELWQAVADAHELIAPLLQQRGLTIETDTQGLKAVVNGDAQRLVQVFVNLLANAAKFAPEGSTVRIGGDAHGGGGEDARPFVEVWVEDEGPGVPGGNVGAIFERFQRGSEAEPEAPGLGLGLWIVKSIVERHGGVVRVERTAAQRTRFSLLLPHAQPTLPQPSEAPA
ncbi:MAG TPA: ATP-binding protein [Steroidobacteraceae bacterium]|nr:ATP-binding protein [Steroidobacteraceae bacterium]